MNIIKGRPVDGDYDFKINANPVFKAEAYNPVISAEAGNSAFKCERGALVDDDAIHMYLCPVLPLSEDSMKTIDRLVNEPVKPSQKLIDLMNRNPRYEKSY